MSNENETPLNIKELMDQNRKDILEAVRQMLKPEPNAKPISISEQEQKPINIFEAYKPKLLESLKNPNESGNFIWSGVEDRSQFKETIGAASAGSAIPEIWARDVFRCCPYPASAFWEAPFIKWHEDIKGRPGDTIHVITVGKAVCGTAGCAEPASTAPTIGASAITLEEYQCSLYICRNDLEDMVPDTVTEINESLASCLDECIDNAFIANLRGKGSTLNKGTAHITPAFIAELMGSMRNGTCEPVVFIIHPVVEARLMQSSQFVNASTYGDRSVITGGHIIQYLGLDIIVVPKGSLVQNAPGTYHSLLLSRYAVHGAKKRDPVIETQYLVQTQRKYIYASVRFGKTAVCEDGVWWMLSGA